MHATLGKIPGGQALVGGNLASSNDWNSQLRRGIVPVFLFVMGVTFLVMLASFSRTTADVVTSAAIIMAAVFAVFGTLSLQQFK